MGKATFTADQMRQLIRHHYSDSEWALLFEVIDAVGGMHQRSADAVAMNTWPSRGLVVHGMEIKVYRSDWLKEKASPAKADVIAKYCDYWYVVAPEDIVLPGELPETWGHMAPSGKGLRVIKPALKLEPVPLDRRFVASVVRNAGRVDEGRVQAAVNEKLASEIERINTRVENEVERRTRELKELKSAVDCFEKESGLQIRSWTAGNLGKKVKVVDAIGVDRWATIPHLATQLRTSADALDKALAEIGIADVLEPSP